MSILVIKDLQDSKELDKKAMQEIVGGRRARPHGGLLRQSVLLKPPRRLFR